ncbi:ABC transporter ATP-binding protein [Spirochaetota bacterium]
MTPVIEVKNLVKYYKKVKAVDGIDLKIDKGTCFGLLGPNGAGKTTAIEVIEGILQPTSGEILYKGKKRRGNFKNEIGVQLQHTELLQHLTVKETLNTFRNLYDQQIDFDYLVEICHLDDIIDRDNRKISGGQKQRLLLAIALANDPELIFLDEPTTGLDPQSRRHVWDIVRQIKSLDKTIILTTHYMEEAEILCDEVGIIDFGKIIELGSPEKLIRKHLPGVIVSLKVDVSEEVLNGLPCSWSKENGIIEVKTNNPNECINALIESGIDLTNMNVRNQNLEDLFLKLTGHELRA